jgi:iron complex transport system substrate-binding protein
MDLDLRDYKFNGRYQVKALRLLLSGAMAIGLSLPAAATASAPQHIMSLSMCTDAMLLELVPLNRIASVTFLSRNPSNSFLWQQAAKVPINYGSAEEVFAEKPDFVLAGTYTTPATRMLMKKVGIPMLEVPPANNFDEIRATTRSVAHALGEDALAEELIAKMDATLKELNSARPTRTIRVAAWNGGGSVPGRGTLFDAILTVAGGVNVASSAGLTDGSFDLEQLLQAQPDVLAFGSDASTTPSLHTDQAQHPLILKLWAGRRISYPSALYSCGLVQSADAAVALRDNLLHALQGERYGAH